MKGAVRDSATLQLLSIGHSYVIALNRRIAHEISREGRGRWGGCRRRSQFLSGRISGRPVSNVSPAKIAPWEKVDVYGSSRVHFMLYALEMRKLLARPWDFVHLWEEPYILCGGQLAAWIPKRVPFVFWTCQNIPKKYPPPFSWIERYCVSRCAGWLACGHTVAQALLPRGYDARPHRVMPFGVDTEIFNPEAPDARSETRMGFLGRARRRLFGTVYCRQRHSPIDERAGCGRDAVAGIVRWRRAIGT